MMDLSQISLSELLAEVDRRTADLRFLAEKEDRRKRDAERQRKCRAKKAAEGADQNEEMSRDGHSNVTPVVTEKTVTPVVEVTVASRDGHSNVTLNGADQPSLSPPPSTPSPSAHPPASTPIRTHARPNLEQVTKFFDSYAGCPVPRANWPEVAQAYLDARERTDPPWTLPATGNRVAVAIGSNWQADCRTFCRNWQQVLAERMARQQAFPFAGNGKNGHSKPKLPDPTEAEISQWFDVRPQYATKRSEWATWNELQTVSFAKEDFLAYRRSLR